MKELLELKEEYGKEKVYTFIRERERKYFSDLELYASIVFNDVENKEAEMRGFHKK